MARAILVVDDDEDVRESLCAVLEDEGYEVVGVEHGRAALDQLQGGFRPCLILLDLMMPVMDGKTFRDVQTQDPALRDIPVVLITAAGRQAASTVAADGVLQKPLRVETLLAIVGQHCPSQSASATVKRAEHD